MHQLGRAAVLQRRPIDGAAVTIAQEREYAFRRQHATPVPPPYAALAPGEELELECVFDSSGQSGVTRAGLTSADEMCTAFIRCARPRTPCNSFRGVR